MESIKRLLEEKINEAFAEIQSDNNITSGDIEPFDSFQLDDLTTDLAKLIETVIKKQMTQWAGIFKISNSERERGKKWKQN